MIKGLGNIKKALEKSVNVLKLKNGESKTIRFLAGPEEIMSTYEHTEQIGGFWKTITCLGKSECPLCQAGKVASFKAYIPVLDRADNKVLIFKASKKTTVYIIGLVEEYDSITNRDFKISRVGDKLDTTYQLFPRDPSKLDVKDIEIPDIESMITPMTREAILAMLDGDAESDDKVEEDELPF